MSNCYCSCSNTYEIYGTPKPFSTPQQEEVYITSTRGIQPDDVLESYEQTQTTPRDGFTDLVDAVRPITKVVNDRYTTEQEYMPTVVPYDTTPPPSTPGQYTPSYTVPGTISYVSRINTSKTIALSVPGVVNHGPEPGWAGTVWDGWDWDGVPIDISNKTPIQICQLLFRNGYFMKGLKQKYNSIQPFANPTNPTIKEFDLWCLEVIKHLRALVGNTTPISLDPKLFLEAQWANDRYFHTVWDTAYPGTDGTAFGPCQPGLDGNTHCGASFLPNATDQAPYLTQYGITPFTKTSRAEGIGNANTDLPWALKFVQQMSAWICSEGTSGHAGPFFSRTKVGWSWYVAGPSTTLSPSTTLRIKWS